FALGVGLLAAGCARAPGGDDASPAGAYDDDDDAGGAAGRAGASASGGRGGGGPAGSGGRGGSAGAGAGGGGAGGSGGGCTVRLVPERELLITALPVVNDPVRTRWTGSSDDPSDGAWSFGRLMTNLAGDRDPEAFVRSWLSAFESDRVINGFVVPARPAVSGLLLAPWPKLAGGRLDLTRAPMRLLAVVNRLDLRNPAAGSAGEGRFVFGVLGPGGEPTEFTVILEYDLAAADAAEVRAWAERWHELGGLDPATAEYRQKLEAITERFAGRNAAPGRPNGSAINQVRTNEIALAAPWELREFALSESGLLVETSLAQTPDFGFNGSFALADFINANEHAMLGEAHFVPLQQGGAPFRAGAVTNNIDFWFAPGVRSNDARHKFSLNTCNGCHGAETGTPFLHVFPREAGEEARLSPFLTGMVMIDPVGGERRPFHDLERRAVSVTSALCAPSTEAIDREVPSARAH
ncbi:MAG TPA: hypothetical protein VFS43_18375, partial [Polyangiaceae bacterium]|nr:hypothetical protein [Polyangiaceae bacterium]